MDVHVPDAITVGLRLRGVDVLTAQEDGARRFPDAMLLDRATALGRVLFSQDDDLLREAAERQQRDVPFAGVVYAHQLRVTIGQCVRDLELLAFGPDHVVFGTDYPYGRNKGEYALESRRRFVDEAKIDEADCKKIYEDNARKLLHLA